MFFGHLKQLGNSSSVFNFVRNRTFRLMDIRQFSLLHCFDCGQDSRSKCALIVTDSESVQSTQCHKIPSFIEDIWKESKFQICTSSAQELVDSFGHVNNTPNQVTNGLKSSLNKKIASLKSNECELSISLQFIVDAIQNGLLDVSGILIASNRSFSMTQVFTYMQLMHACQESLESQNICVSGIFGHSYTCILPSGHSELRVCSGHEGDYCGILPIGHAAKLTTTGLVWNLNNQILEFAGLLSSSNKLDGSGKVSVISDSSVLWTMGINCDVDHSDDV